jgi:hypothetical protein
MCGECGNFTLVRNGTCMKCVGWVERSDTHQLLFMPLMGFAKGSTHPTRWETLDEDISIAGLLAGRGDVTRSTEHAA